jgi:hypothetical protein
MLIAGRAPPVPTPDRDVSIPIVISVVTGPVRPGCHLVYLAVEWIPGDSAGVTLPEVLILALPVRTLSQVGEPGLHPILFCWSRLAPG